MDIIGNSLGGLQSQIGNILSGEAGANVPQGQPQNTYTPPPSFATDPNTVGIGDFERLQFPGSGADDPVNQPDPNGTIGQPVPQERALPQFDPTIGKPTPGVGGQFNILPFDPPTTEARNDLGIGDFEKLQFGGQEGFEGPTGDTSPYGIPQPTVAQNDLSIGDFEQRQFNNPGGIGDPDPGTGRGMFGEPLSTMVAGGDVTTGDPTIFGPDAIGVMGDVGNALAGNQFFGGGSGAPVAGVGGVGGRRSFLSPLRGLKDSGKRGVIGDLLSPGRGGTLSNFTKSLF